MKSTQSGFFITLEGTEGVGKSTAAHYIGQVLKEKNIAFILTREPGGTPLAEDIRQILLSHHTEIMNEDTELLLMFAGRAQHLHGVIKPALQKNQWVICDRFTDATYAYQGGGRKIAEGKIAELEKLIQGELQPNLTFLLDAPVELCLQRAHLRSSPDRFEKEKIDFFQRVREKYLERAVVHSQRFKIVDVTETLEQVQARIKLIVEQAIISFMQNKK